VKGTINHTVLKPSRYIHTFHEPISVSQRKQDMEPVIYTQIYTNFKQQFTKQYY